MFRVHQSLVLSYCIKEGMASGISMIHVGGVIPSRIRRTGFIRLHLLCEGRRRQLKGRTEFQIIPEYILCTSLFCNSVFSGSLASLGQVKWGKTKSKSPPETFIPVRLLNYCCNLLGLWSWSQYMYMRHEEKWDKLVFKNNTKKQCQRSAELTRLYSGLHFMILCVLIFSTS